MAGLLKILIFAAGAIVGAIALAWYATDISGRPGWDFIGAILGAIAGALASISVWVFAYFETEHRRRQERQGLVGALWTDTVGLQWVLYREARWWKDAARIDRINTEDRIRSHFDTPVLNANLHRIGELPTQTADSLLTIRANVIAIKEGMDLYFRQQQEMMDGPLLEGETPADLMALSKRSRSFLFHQLLTQAAAARVAARRLDPQRDLSKHHLTTIVGDKPHLKEITVMNQVLDRLAVRFSKNL